MFGILKSEPHVQPKAGCYSNQIHYDEARSTLIDVSSLEQDVSKRMIKDFWIRNCEVIRNHEQVVEQVVARKHADQLLAFTKKRALQRITLKHNVA
jgi:hypothetical protein